MEVNSIVTYLDALDAHDFEAAVDLFAPDALYLSPNPPINRV
jgi:ketosteroid isomerase-like protein